MFGRKPWTLGPDRYSDGNRPGTVRHRKAPEKSDRAGRGRYGLCRGCTRLADESAAPHGRECARTAHTVRGNGMRPESRFVWRYYDIEDY